MTTCQIRRHRVFPYYLLSRLSGLLSSLTMQLPKTSSTVASMHLSKEDSNAVVVFHVRFVVVLLSISINGSLSFPPVHSAPVLSRVTSLFLIRTGRNSCQDGSQTERYSRVGISFRRGSISSKEEVYVSERWKMH